MAGWPANTASAQAPINVYDLADYRLTPEMFEQFVNATAPIAEIAGHDPVFTYAPLFTKDVMLDGDAPTVAVRPRRAPREPRRPRCRTADGENESAGVHEVRNCTGRRTPGSRVPESWCASTGPVGGANTQRGVREDARTGGGRRLADD